MPRTDEVQRRADPSVRRRRVLANEDCVELGAVVRGNVQPVLLNVRPAPRRGRVLVLEPAELLVLARVVPAGLLAVQADDGVEHRLRVLVVGEADVAVAPVAAAVLRDEARPGGGLVEPVDGVVQRADGVGRGLRVAAKDGPLAVFPEALGEEQRELARPT